MTGTISARAVATVVLLAAVGCRAHERDADADQRVSTVALASTADASGGLLYGRVTTDDGTTYEGRLRFGGDEEALWSNYFNGHKRGNTWAAHVPQDLLPKERHSAKVFGIELATESRRNLGRPFMTRFGDITRLEARGRDLFVTLKSGTVAHLNRYAADDYADGVRIWDSARGVVDLHERRIRSIDFLPSAASAVDTRPIFGTVRTRNGVFTGLIQWNRKQCLGADELRGRSAGENFSARFDEIRSIVRRVKSAQVTLIDGRQIALDDSGERGIASGGIYVDDARYGRVLISWDAFESVDFKTGAAAPAYNDYGPGQPLAGTVVTQSGRRLTGRLVYDLDESETTETLDAPSRGVDYTIPFTLIASITPVVERGTIVTLASGEQLQLERAGDLAESNAGLLVFMATGPIAQYVSWSDVSRIDFDVRPRAESSTTRR